MPKTAAKPIKPIVNSRAYILFDFSVHRSLTGFAAERLKRCLAPGQKLNRLEGRQVVIKLPSDPEQRKKAAAELRLAGRILGERVQSQARSKL